MICSYSYSSFISVDSFFIYRSSVYRHPPALPPALSSLVHSMQNSTLETVFRPLPTVFLRAPVITRIISADCKRGRRKGATSKNVKNRQKVSKSFSTLFDNFRAGQKSQKSSKSVKDKFSGPFWGALIIACLPSPPCPARAGLQRLNVMGPLGHL